MVARSRLLVLLFVVLLAGCSGLVGDDEPGSSEETLDSPEAFDYPEGFSADGITDGDRAVDSYNAGVQSHQNYTGEQRYLIDGEDGETDVNVTYEVEFPAAVAFQRSGFETPDGEGFIEFYYADGERFVRSGSNGQESGVSTQEWAFSADNQTSVEGLEPLLRNVTSYETSVEERDGASLVRFETTDAQDPEGFFEVGEGDELADFEASFLLDSDGVIHEASYEFSLVNDEQTRSVSFTFEIHDLGETSVDRPGWVDEAQ